LQTSYERMLRSGSENEYVYKWLFVGGIAEALTTLGEFDQAEGLILERLAKDDLPSGFIGRLEARRALAMIQIARGQTNEAVANMNKILQALEQHSPDDQSRLDFVRSGLGEALYANGELAQARSLLEAVLVRQKSENSGKPNDVPLTKARLSAVLLAQGQAREAVVLIMEAVQAARGFMHPHNPQLAWLLAIESQVLLANGKPKEAFVSFQTANQIIEGSGLGEYYVMQLRPSCEALQLAELLNDSVAACR
jgi:tetratricopeptide (TPR) repeat protein